MFKRKKPVKKIIIILMIISIIFGGVLFIDLHVRPTVYSIAEVRVTQMAIDAINEAVREELGEKNIRYQDFVTLQKDNQGRIAVMQANTVRVNELQANMALEVQERLKDLQDEVLRVPLGQVLGSYIFAHWGPDIKVKVRPMGTVDIEVNDKFRHAGINQTRHRIYFDFTTMVRIVIPLGSAEVEVATQVPVAETVIVGEVPEVVADFSGGIFGGSDSGIIGGGK